MIDIPVILILEGKERQLTQLKWEKVQKRNCSLFGPLEIDSEAESERNSFYERKENKRGGREGVRLMEGINEDRMEGRDGERVFGKSEEVIS